MPLLPVTPHPDDRRQVLVVATDAGLDVVRRTLASRDTWMASRLDGLDAEQLVVLRQAADILLDVAAHG